MVRIVIADPRIQWRCDGLIGVLDIAAIYELRSFNKVDRECPLTVANLHRIVRKIVEGAWQIADPTRIYLPRPYPK